MSKGSREISEYPSFPSQYRNLPRGSTRWLAHWIVPPALLGWRNPWRQGESGEPTFLSNIFFGSFENWKPKFAYHRKRVFVPTTFHKQLEELVPRGPFGLILLENVIRDFQVARCPLGLTCPPKFSPPELQVIFIDESQRGNELMIAFGCARGSLRGFQRLQLSKHLWNEQRLPHPRYTSSWGSA